MMANGDPCEWTVEEVGTWLKSIGFEEYRHLFCDKHHIDGRVLLRLTESDLKNPPVSMTVLGDLKKIIYEIEFLKQMSRKRSAVGLSEKALTFTKHGNCLINEHQSSQNLNACKPESQSCMSSNLEPEFKKLFVATIYLMFVLLLTTYTMVVVHDWVPNMDKYPPLPDIALDKIPYIPWAFEACEITTLAMGAILCLILLFHKHRFIIIRRLFALSGTVFILRCITMMITSLSVPGTHLQCEPRAIGDFSTRLEMALKIYSGFGMSIKGVRTCGDYMFSGHTVVVTMFNFFITEYTPRKLYWLHIFSWVANFFAVFFILAAHEHYSIDVFVAFYITTRLFLYYHSLANHRVLSQKDSRTRIWFPMFAFFESSLNGSVPNDFELPWLRLGEYLCTWVKHIRCYFRKADDLNGKIRLSKSSNSILQHEESTQHPSLRNRKQMSRLMK